MKDASPVRRKSPSRMSVRTIIDVGMFRIFDGYWRSTWWKVFAVKDGAGGVQGIAISDLFRQYFCVAIEGGHG